MSPHELYVNGKGTQVHCTCEWWWITTTDPLPPTVINEAFAKHLLKTRKEASK